VAPVFLPEAGLARRRRSTGSVSSR